MLYFNYLSSVNARALSIYAAYCHVYVENTEYLKVQ